MMMKKSKKKKRRRRRRRRKSRKRRNRKRRSSSSSSIKRSDSSTVPQYCRVLVSLTDAAVSDHNIYRGKSQAVSMRTRAGTRRHTQWTLHRDI